MSNSLQAALERAAKAQPEPEAAAPAQPPVQSPTPAPTPAAKARPSATPSPTRKSRRTPKPKEELKFFRPSRVGRRFLGGHFAPEVIKHIKMLAVEEDTTTQALLEEALELLFIKKGRAMIIGV